MNDADREFFARPNTQINVERMRREALKDAENGKKTIIHLHAAPEPCEGSEHEKYGYEEDEVTDA